MADNLYNIAQAGLDDGTIDFYTLIQESPDADTETLRAKIQALYLDAQANRDHRNLTRRREYQTLLDWLPRAKAALLEPEKRARYNAYLASVQSGTTAVAFEEFMNDLMGQNETMEAKTGLLGVQDKNQQPRARTIKAPVETPKTPAAKPSRVPSTTPARSSFAPIIVPLLALVIVPLLANLVIHRIFPSILIGIIVSALSFVFLNSKPRGGIRS